MYRMCTWNRITRLPQSTQPHTQKWCFGQLKEAHIVPRLHTMSRVRVSKQLAEAAKAARPSGPASEMTKKCLERASDMTHLNAYITTFEKDALLNALLSDQRLKAGKGLALDGVTVAVKDNFCVRGQKTTAASKMLENFIAPYDATVIRKLKDAGAILVGKTNMDEFGMGTYNTHSYFGPVRNPLDETKVAGGSSGGSAAAVAAGTCSVAVGSDTGGSIRLPASYCGVVGIKPAYGHVSRWGLIAYASSLDTVGVLSRTLIDGMDVLECIAEEDENDSTTYPAYQRGPWTLCAEDVLSSTFGDSSRAALPLRGIRVGVPQEFKVAELSQSALDMWIGGLSYLQSLGASIKSCSLPSLRYALPAYYILAPAEAASNLAKFDGICYGASEDEGHSGTYTNTRTRSFGTSVQKRILTGNVVLSSSHRGLYESASNVRSLLTKEFHHAFKNVDVMIAPTTTSSAPTIQEALSRDILMEYADDVLTVPANLAKIPAISIPVQTGSFEISGGRAGEHSLQVMGPVSSGACAGGISAKQIAVAHAIELMQLDLT